MGGFRTESTDVTKKRKPRTSYWSRLKRHCGRSGLRKALLFCKKLVHEVLKLLRSGKKRKERVSTLSNGQELSGGSGQHAFYRTAAKI